MWLVHAAHTKEQVCQGCPGGGGAGGKGRCGPAGGAGGGSGPQPYNTQDGHASSTASSLKFNLSCPAPYGLRFAALGP